MVVWWCGRGWGGQMNMNKVEEADGAGGIVWNINITYLWWRGKIWVSYPQHQESNQIWILYIFRHSDVNGPS